VLLKRNTGKMVDERQRVIRDLLQRLAEVGVDPDRPFQATFLPGVGWTFENYDESASSSSSSAGTGGVRGTKVLPR